jgi:hypothetical protein
MDHGKAYYKEYDQQVFEHKATVDLFYYSLLLKNLDEQYSDPVHKKLTETYKVVKAIYEFVNLQPEFFGKGINGKILEESIDNTNKKLKEVLLETIDKQFYQLTPEQRTRKYGAKAKRLAETILTENDDIKESIQYSIKTCIVEDLLLKIAFPKTTWNRVQYLVESEQFGKVFDQQKLIELTEELEQDINILAKYICTCI